MDGGTCYNNTYFGNNERGHPMSETALQWICSMSDHLNILLYTD